MAEKNSIKPEDEKLNEQSENFEQTIEEDADLEMIKQLTEQLEEQKRKTDEYLDSLKRNMAEFDNYKKRTLKERDNMYLSIVTDVLATIIPVIDNFEKAMDAECKDTEYKNGIDLIYKDLMNVLKKYNVEPIEDIGHTFDPEFHEAVMSVVDETKGEKEIVEVFRRGYKMGDRIVRHSLVKVAN